MSVCILTASEIVTLVGTASRERSCSQEARTSSDGSGKGRVPSEAIRDNEVDYPAAWVGKLQARQGRVSGRHHHRSHTASPRKTKPSSVPGKSRRGSEKQKTTGTFISAGLSYFIIVSIVHPA